MLSFSLSSTDNSPHREPTHIHECMLIPSLLNKSCSHWCNIPISSILPLLETHLFGGKDLGQKLSYSAPYYMCLLYLTFSHLPKKSPRALPSQGRFYFTGVNFFSLYLIVSDTFLNFFLFISEAGRHSFHLLINTSNALHHGARLAPGVRNST